MKNEVRKQKQEHGSFWLNMVMRKYRLQQQENNPRNLGENFTEDPIEPN